MKIFGLGVLFTISLNTFANCTYFVDPEVTGCPSEISNLVIRRVIYDRLSRMGYTTVSYKERADKIVSVDFNCADTREIVSTTAEVTVFDKVSGKTFRSFDQASGIIDYQVNKRALKKALRYIPSCSNF